MAGWRADMCSRPSAYMHDRLLTSLSCFPCTWCCACTVHTRHYPTFHAAPPRCSATPVQCPEAGFFCQNHNLTLELNNLQSITLITKLPSTKLLGNVLHILPLNFSSTLLEVHPIAFGKWTPLKIAWKMTFAASTLMLTFLLNYFQSSSLTLKTRLNLRGFASRNKGMTRVDEMLFFFKVSYL